ncbi:hypothetical protein N7522_009852 [Penicillium canescens]|uniref:Uncharacterized protein n=1 Tax=Penicillium canescens TaxID=5083 RepID=A0AAD6I0A3_PENCN|nr:uncharacterized protein N7446_004968 [Penicillium canescens]KAJ5998192.1 hypothetical protein N7522_009852 [Penicillium canescens]KAJ6026432.1 hypothetical protein N7460_011249 [Penicillium canescens]KAJ6039715.1 hypothetical protein N7444_008620 [Penicillium canescens]KAJ6067931.1 hypothetical protein N7446_004968 [Penicillium canescens]
MLTSEARPDSRPNPAWAGKNRFGGNDLLGNCVSITCYGTVLMLALMTWHFDASSSKASQDLIDFLRCPYNSEVKRILEGRYRSRMRETGSPNFDFLLVLN